MLEIYSLTLTNAARNLKSNIVKSPVLYTIFTIMILFSIGAIAMLTFFIIKNDIIIYFNDIFFTIFFLFMLKSSYDFYSNYTRSKPLVYTLSSPVSYRKTVFEIFLYSFWVQLGLWVLLTSFYNALLILLGVNLIYSIEYIKIIFGIMLASVLGSLISLHLFSNKKFRLAPVAFLIFLLWNWNELVSILIIFLFSFLYLLISLNYSLDSYDYNKKKERKKEKYQIWTGGIKNPIFKKEVTLLWREKLLFSILFTSVSMGIFSGYLSMSENTAFLPENIQALISVFPKEIYSFFGIYVITIYASVFISLNSFLNEENTLWLIRCLPVSGKTIVKGKAQALFLPFLCSIPFIVYFWVFSQGDSILFLIFFLIFSFLIGIIISFPIGAKFIGRKSDILLLYSLSMIILLILGVSYMIVTLINSISLWLVGILIEVLLLYLSLELSSKIVSRV